MNGRRGLGVRSPGREARVFGTLIGQLLRIVPGPDPASGGVPGPAGGVPVRRIGAAGRPARGRSGKRRRDGAGVTDAAAPGAGAEGCGYAVDGLPSVSGDRRLARVLRSPA